MLDGVLVEPASTAVLPAPSHPRPVCLVGVSEIPPKIPLALRCVMLEEPLYFARGESCCAHPVDDTLQHFLAARSVRLPRARFDHAFYMLRRIDASVTICDVASMLQERVIRSLKFASCIMRNAVTTRCDTHHHGLRLAAIAGQHHGAQHDDKEMKSIRSGWNQEGTSGRAGPSGHLRGVSLRSLHR